MQCLALFIAPLMLWFGVAVFAQNPQLPVQPTDTPAKTEVLIKSEAPPATHQLGLRTERLSAKDLQRWNQIENIVFARTSDGQYLHPTLINLWEWIETSGHTVYLQFVKPLAKLSSTAGQFKIEKLDPRGEHHIGVIELNLTNIDMAYVRQEARDAAGFIPFENLGREERYAEVLGHEMAHAADILTSLERTTNVEMMVEMTNELLMHHLSLKRTEQITVELQHRLHRRDEVLKKLESAANRLEAVIWRELSAGKAARTSLRK